MSWAHYILQVNLYLVVFYGFYRLLLAKETYFTLNRVYLVASGILSLIIPFLRFESLNHAPLANPVYTRMTQLNELLMITGATQDVQSKISLGSLVAVLYITGIIYFAVRMMLQLFILNRHLSKRVPGSAFSFFKKKIVDPALPQQQTIHEHEDIHIRQLHSIDVILFELISILNWFNPVVYFYKHTIKSIHEYLADEAAAKFQGDKKEYAMILLSNAFGIKPNNLTNSFFNQSLIKKRIFMLHKERSKKTAILKYGLFVPMFALMLILSSATIRENETIRAVASELPLETPVATVTNLVEQVSGIQKKAQAFNEIRFEDWSQFYAHIQRVIKYPAKAHEAKLTGYTHVKFVIKNGASTGVNIVAEPLGEGCDTEVMKAIISYPHYSALPDGKYTLSVVFKLDGHSGTLKNKNIPAIAGYTKLKDVIIMGYLPRPETDLSKLKADDSGTVFNFISLTSAPTYPGGMEKLYTYLAKSIKYPVEAQNNKVRGRVNLSFIIETDGALSDIKVEKAAGHGFDEEAIRVIKASQKWIPGIQNNIKVRSRYTLPVIFSTTKISEAPPIDLTESIEGKMVGTIKIRGAASNPLYIIDGEKQDMHNTTPLKDVDPNSISSVEILKDETAIKLYGEEAKKGVIIITTKDKKANSAE